MVSSSSWNWTPREPDARPSHPLLRRGVHHGFLLRGAGPPPRPPGARRAAELWAAAEPLYFPRLLRPADARNAIRRTQATLDRVRREEAFAFEDEVWKRLAGRRGFEAAGSSVDLGDPREIEKVHVDGRTRGRRDRDLWAKLSWVTMDPRDGSLRIRFSFGSERLGDWSTDAARAAAADRLAEAVFPECLLIAANRTLRGALARLVGRGARLSERIVFSNAPGGGAVFHHDAETEQRGVVFAQLAGRTAWLALPKRRLAAEVTGLGPWDTEAEAMRELDRGDSPELEQCLNRSRRLTKALVAAGDCYVLAPGDVLLLPSHGPDDVAWHSVFGLGSRPSLAHSYGIFGPR